MFDGRDMTYAPPNEVAARGVVQMPGGRGTFPALTVAEHLRLASWLHRKDKQRVAEATEHVLDLFPVLRARLDEPAGNLSGGQQQMLALSMAFIEQPRLLMIDELSLGLAPTIVEQLLPLVRDFAAQGTTVILVEQSVNLALTIAETAYFMEKGEIRFHGPTAELLERPDVLRSVFLEGADTLGHARRRRPSRPDGARHAGAGRARRHGNGPTTARRRRAERAARDPARARRRVEAVRRARRADRRVVHGARRRDRRHHRPERRGQDHAVRHDLGLHARRRGHDRARRRRRRARHHAHAARAPRAPRARPLVPGRPAVPVAHRRGDRRARRSSATSRCATRSAPRCTCRSSPTPKPTPTRRVEELLELLGITDFRDKLGRELSTGSRRIVDLACVLAHSPSVLLLDEPSSGIAQREAEALGPLLLRIREQTGATLLVIEHDVPLLLSISDRLIALDLGEIVASGLPDDVVRDPIVVTSYLGTTEAVIARSGARGAS